MRIPQRTFDYLILWTLGFATSLGVIGLTAVVRKITPSTLFVAAAGGAAVVAVEVLTEADRRPQPPLGSLR